MRCVLIALVLLSAHTAAAQTLHFPQKLDLPGFQAVVADTGPVIVSGQPTEQALRDLAAHGVTTVITLRTQQEMDDRRAVPFDEAALAKTLGWNPVSFALPAALCIDWVVGLPISGKPNVILFSTNQYSVVDNFKYGVTTCTVGVILLVVSAMTWFHWIGLTPSFWAVAP